MTDEDKDFERGMALLNENPPKLIEALSLFKKAKIIFEQKGRMKERNSAKDKISYIYRLLSEKEYEAADAKLKNTEYKDAILRAVQSQKYLYLSDTKNPERSSKKIKSLIENSIIELLYNIESRAKKNGYSDDLLTEIKFIEKTIMDIFYKHLILRKNNEINEWNEQQVIISDNIIGKIGNMKKVQQYLINAYEMLANQAVTKSQELIETGNIENALKMINLAEELYNYANFTDKVKDIHPIYMKVYEAQGDIKFLRGKQLAEDGRLEKSREFMKQARSLYKKAENDNKEKMVKSNYLEISTKLGEQIMKMGDEAANLYHFKEAIKFYEQSYEFFNKLKHPKYPQICEKKIKELYNILADKDLENAESITHDSILQLSPDNELQQLNGDSEAIADFSIDTELLLRKLALYHDALYNFRKAANSSLEHKMDKTIHEYSEKIAELLYDLAKRQIKNNLYEHAYLNLNKSQDYYRFIGNDRKVNSISGQMEKIYKKIDLIKLEELKIKRILLANQEPANTQNQIQVESSSISAENDQKSVPIEISSSNSVESSIMKFGEQKDDLYRCKECGELVKAQYFDSFQEKCINHRTRIFCDECGNEILANVIYQTCINCGAKFCENCWDRVYDFAQKKCMSCRVIQHCAVCGKESQINQVFEKCPSCGQDFCDEHWDFNQNLCINCRKKITCSTCGKEISGNEIFTCVTCMHTFCGDHFDRTRRQCLTDRKDEICTKCGVTIKSNELAFRCPQCGFIYCPNHFSVFHNKCHRCLPGPNLTCFNCNRSLYNEKFYRCIDCNNIFCADHFHIRDQRCGSCLKLASVCKICNKLLETESERFKCKNCGQYFCINDFNSEQSLCKNCATFIVTPSVQIYPEFEKDIYSYKKDEKDGKNIGIQETPGFTLSLYPDQNSSSTIDKSAETKPDPKILHLEANTLKKLVDKYNSGSNINPDEINFLIQHSINLPKDESEYLYLREMGDIIIVLKDIDGKSYVCIAPNYPLIEHCKYYGDLIKKLIRYFPDVRETIDGKSCIINLLFYTANAPQWSKIYELLRQTLLKSGIEIMNVLRNIFKRTPIRVISDSILKSPFESLFSGIDLNEAIKFIQTEETEDEADVFSENERLNQILRAFYNLYRGDVLRAADIISIFEI